MDQKAMDEREKRFLMAAAVPLEQVRVNDRFGEVGTPDYLMAKFALTAQDIVNKAIKCLGRKKR